MVLSCRLYAHRAQHLQRSGVHQWMSAGGWWSLSGTRRHPLNIARQRKFSLFFVLCLSVGSSCVWRKGGKEYTHTDTRQQREGGGRRRRRKIRAEMGMYVQQCRAFNIFVCVIVWTNQQKVVERRQDTLHSATVEEEEKKKKIGKGRSCQSCRPTCLVSRHMTPVDCLLFLRVQFSFNVLLLSCCLSAAKENQSMTYGTTCSILYSLPSAAATAAAAAVHRVTNTPSASELCITHVVTRITTEYIPKSYDKQL